MQEVKISFKTGNRPKLGLALSGGGFRASFFHLGVLASMADLGLLRHLEVISTVSGGSIIGALYYINIKKLLETKADLEITDEDYRQILDRMEKDFFRVIGLNLRMRTFLNPFKNLKMGFTNYSRSDYFGELLDKFFYRPVMGDKRKKPVMMRELKIHPKGEESSFHPLKNNNRRSAKVPIILINATALNTGHNWRFSATRMGEPPRLSETEKEIDKNLRLRRPPNYKFLPDKLRDFSLGLAVAASSCVPGIFPPVSIEGMYPEGIRVELVDGGVCDNQGIQGLIDPEFECNRFIISDASGQLEDVLVPSTNIAAVIQQTNQIFMDRLREEELTALLSNDSPVAFLHLLKGQGAKAISWKNREGFRAEATFPERLAKEPSESFGVTQEVQKLLASLRTDLDSFTEIEAYSLMADGYKMGMKEFRQINGIQELISESSIHNKWDFMAAEKWLSHPNPRYLRRLRVGGDRVLKIFRLNKGVTLLTLALGGVLVLFIWPFLSPWLEGVLSQPVTFGVVLAFAVLLALGYMPYLGPFFRLYRYFRIPGDFFFRLVIRGIIPLGASVFVFLFLIIFNPLFLKDGKIDKPEPPVS